MRISKNLYTTKSIWSVIVIGFFTLVFLGACLTGNRARIMVPQSINASVTSPEQAYGIWSSKRVHGRILLLFDTYPHMRGLAYYDDTPLLTSWNLVEYSIFKNIVRKIFFVVPDTQWDEFRKRRDIGIFRPYGNNGNNGKGAYLFTMSGVPLISVPASSLPHIDEKVLLYVNSRVTSPDQVTDLLHDRQIVSDCIIVQQGGG